SLVSPARTEGLGADVVSQLEGMQTALSLSGTGTFELTRKAALGLLSLLPILEDWDTWGCFTRARHVVSAKRTTASRLPPSHYKTHWLQPFHIAEFTFNGSNTESASWKLIGKEVTIEVYCRDLATPNHALSSVTKDDFFAYCYRPVVEE